MINAVTDIQEDTVVEVVISAQSLGEDDVEIRPHALSIHSYKSPTFCHFCGEMLFGMFKQVSREGMGGPGLVIISHAVCASFPCESGHNYKIDQT